MPNVNATLNALFDLCLQSDRISPRNLDVLSKYNWKYADWRLLPGGGISGDGDGEGDGEGEGLHDC